MKSNYARLTPRDISDKQLRVITAERQKSIAFFGKRPGGST
jgi:hypothetical protein